MATPKSMTATIILYHLYHMQGHVLSNLFPDPRKCQKILADISALRVCTVLRPFPSAGSGQAFAEAIQSNQEIAPLRIARKDGEESCF